MRTILYLKVESRVLDLAWPAARLPVVAERNLAAAADSEAGTALRRAIVEMLYLAEGEAAGCLHAWRWGAVWVYTAECDDLTIPRLLFPRALSPQRFVAPTSQPAAARPAQVPVLISPARRQLSVPSSPPSNSLPTFSLPTPNPPSFRGLDQKAKSASDSPSCR